jgi:DNA repair ATPase RecN
MRGKRIIHLFIVYFLIFSFLGCEAFVRKFTRKPKKGNLPKEELVLVPEEYKGPQMSKEELYRQYFLFWKSWHDELIGSLSEGANRKKQKDCLNETIKNLQQLRLLLNDGKKAKLDIYINQIKNLDEIITQDLYGNNIALNRLTAEQIKRNILRDFSYNKISKDINYGAVAQ